MVGPCQLDLQQSRTLPPQLLLCRDVSSTHRRPIYMDTFLSVTFCLASRDAHFVDGLCLCNGTCTIILQPTPMLDMDLVSSTVMQCIQPSAQLRRRQSQSSLAPSPLRANNRVPSYCSAVGHRRVMSILVINLRPRPRSDDHGPRGHDLHI